MNNAVILHGKPTKDRYFNSDITKPHNANWFPWIREKLTERGVTTSIPPLPRPYYPVYEDWRKVFENETLEPSTGLVGHSAGAEFILRWFSANKEAEFERIVLVAPYRDYAGKYEDFSKYNLDSSLSERVGRLSIINSLDDDEPIRRRAHDLLKVFPRANYIELDGYGHFRIGHNMTGPEFPVLLEELTN